MTEIQKTRITVLNFLMTCVIVLFHCDLKKGDIVSSCISSLAALAMCFFFWVTALLLFRDLSFANYKTKILRRLKSLLIPYLLWELIFAVKDVILGGGLSAGKLLQSIFLLKGSLPDGALWYVYVVFWLAVISPVFLWIFKHKWLSDILLFVCVPATFFILNCTEGFLTFEIEAAWLRRTIGYLGAYYYGAYYGYYVLNCSETQTVVLKKIVLCVVVCYLLNPFMPGVLTSCIICGMPLALFLISPMKESIKDWRIFNLSFLVYAIHQPLVQVLRKRVDRVAVRLVSVPWVQSVIYYAISLFIVLLTATVIYLVMKKLLPRVLKVLSGGRAR